MLKSIIFLIAISSFSLAQAWTIDHFNVKFAEKEITAWEAVDVTIEAVDEAGAIVKDYTWNIVWFSETDSEAELPKELLDDTWFTFKKSDAWVKKFENWVTFVASGDQELSIYDTDASDSVIWVWKIKVNPKRWETWDESIEILSPENNTSIWTSSTKISGETTKNHNILIVLNSKQEFTTTSNAGWIFEKEISGLENGENIIQAFVLDSSDKKIGESNKVNMTVNGTEPTFKKITLTPIEKDGTIEEWKSIIVNVFANPKLKEVNVVINDTLVKLEETEDWLYVWSFNAPNEAKKYDINVNLKDDAWHNVEKKAATSITVKKIELNSAPTTGTWVQEELNLKITWLKLVTLKTKSILTWDNIVKAEWYNVYKKNTSWNLELVTTTKEPRFEIEATWKEVKFEDFAIKAFIKSASWEIIEWDLSEATKIQTWPEMIILILVSLLLGIWFMLYRRKQILEKM